MRKFNKYIGKYKGQKNYSYFDTNFDCEALIYKENEYLILFCNVMVSMSLFDNKKLSKDVNPTEKFVTAWCSCMAEASRCCNHIVATLCNLFYLFSLYLKLTFPSLQLKPINVN